MTGEGKRKKQKGQGVDFVRDFVDWLRKRHCFANIEVRELSDLIELNSLFSLQRERSNFSFLSYLSQVEQVIVPVHVRRPPWAVPYKQSRPNGWCSFFTAYHKACHCWIIYVSQKILFIVWKLILAGKPWKW